MTVITYIFIALLYSRHEMSYALTNVSFQSCHYTFKLHLK